MVPPGGGGRGDGLAAGEEVGKSIHPAKPFNASTFKACPDRVSHAPFSIAVILSGASQRAQSKDLPRHEPLPFPSALAVGGSGVDREVLRLRSLTRSAQDDSKKKERRRMTWCLSD